MNPLNMTRFLLLSLAIMLPAGQAMAQPTEPYISVSGTGEITTRPDRANINMTVQSQALSSADAKREVDNRSNAFFKELKDMGIEEEQITAGNLNIHPQYDYRNREARFLGFQASRTISIEIRDLNKLNAVLDTAVSSGVDGIQGIGYFSSNEKKMKEQARMAAIEDSKKMAKLLAESYGAKLGPVQSINYYGMQVSQPYFAQADATGLMRGFAGESASSGQFIPGEVSVTDQISVVFSLIHQ